MCTHMHGNHTAMHGRARSVHGRATAKVLCPLSLLLTNRDSDAHTPTPSTRGPQQVEPSGPMEYFQHGCSLIYRGALTLQVL